MSTQFPSVWMTPLLILSFGKEQNLSPPHCNRLWRHKVRTPNIGRGEGSHATLRRVPDGWVE